MTKEEKKTKDKLQNFLKEKKNNNLRVRKVRSLSLTKEKLGSAKKGD